MLFTSSKKQYVMRYKAIQLQVLIFLVIFCSAPRCFADGCFMPALTLKLPEIPFQRTLIKYRDEMETMVVEATLDGDGQSFG
jgi:hypothetical protein